MKNQFIKKILYISFIMSSLITFAQAEDPENPFEDPGVAPIDNFILPTILVVILFTFFMLREESIRNK